jgi:hypothetical protein
MRSIRRSLLYRKIEADKICCPALVKWEPFPKWNFDYNLWVKSVCEQVLQSSFIDRLLFLFNY